MSEDKQAFLSLKRGSGKWNNGVETRSGTGICFFGISCIFKSHFIGEFIRREWLFDLVRRQLQVLLSEFGLLLFLPNKGALGRKLFFCNFAQKHLEEFCASRSESFLLEDYSSTGCPLKLLCLEDIFFSWSPRNLMSFFL